MLIYPIRKAWSQWLTVFGFLMMGVATLAAPGRLFFASELWAMASFLAAGSGMWVAATMRNLTAHRVWMATVTAFAVLRIIDFLQVGGRYTGVAVWVLILGLSLSKYRAVVRIVAGNVQ